MQNSAKSSNSSKSRD